MNMFFLDNSDWYSQITFIIELIAVFIIPLYFIFQIAIKKANSKKRLMRFIKKHQLHYTKHMNLHTTDIYNIYMDDCKNFIISSVYFPIIMIQKFSKSILEYVKFEEIKEIKCILNGIDIFNFSSDSSMKEFTLDINKDNTLILNINTECKDINVILINRFLIAKNETMREELKRKIYNFINQFYISLKK